MTTIGVYYKRKKITDPYDGTFTGEITLLGKNAAKIAVRERGKDLFEIVSRMGLRKGKPTGYEGRKFHIHELQGRTFKDCEIDLGGPLHGREVVVTYRKVIVPKGT